MGMGMGDGDYDLIFRESKPKQKQKTFLQRFENPGNDFPNLMGWVNIFIILF